MKKNIPLQPLPLQALNSWKWVLPVSFILTWSSGAIFVKLGLEYANPFTFVFLRFLLSTALLWGICLMSRFIYPKTIKRMGVHYSYGASVASRIPNFLFFCTGSTHVSGNVGNYFGCTTNHYSFFGGKQNQVVWAFFRVKRIDFGCF